MSARASTKNESTSQRFTKPGPATSARSTYGSSTAFAQHLDVSPQRWEQRRRGILLGLELGLLLVPKCPGVTLDWLYLCKVEGVKLRMARALGALEGYPTGRLRRAEV